MKITKLTEEQFDELFTTVENHLDTNAGWSGSMFETFGEELEYVKMKAKSGNNVWTLVEGDDDTMYISNGMRLVNRMGYFITREEWEEETDVEIDMTMEDEHLDSI
jgi:hypothetical protein